jgi:hypothetical protein
VVARPAAVGLVVGLAGGHAERAPAAAIRNVAQLLDVDMHKFAGLAAANWFAGCAIDVPEPVDPAADQNPMHGGGREPDPIGDRDRTEALLPTLMHDLAIAYVVAARISGTRKG